MRNPIRAFIAALGALAFLATPALAAFPVIVTTGVSSPASSTSWTVTLPASLVSGNLLLAECQANGADVITVPTNWTSLFNPADGTFAFYKYSNGSEGASVTVTGGSSRSAGCVVYQISGTDGVTAPAIGNFAETTSSSYDPPSLTPSWGSANTMWFAYASGRSNVTASVGPSGFSALNTQVSGGSNAVVIIWNANITTATEDPSAFTLSGTMSGYALTVGVRPAASATVSYPINIPMVGM